MIASAIALTRYFGAASALRSMSGKGGKKGAKAAAAAVAGQANQSKKPEVRFERKIDWNWRLTFSGSTACESEAGISASTIWGDAITCQGRTLTSWESLHVRTGYTAERTVDSSLLTFSAYRLPSGRDEDGDRRYSVHARIAEPQAERYIGIEAWVLNLQ